MRNVIGGLYLDTVSVLSETFYITAERKDLGVTFSLVTKLWKRYQSSWISIRTSAFYQVRDFRNFYPSCRHFTRMFDVYMYVCLCMSIRVEVYCPFQLLKTRPEHPQHRLDFIPLMMLQSSAEFKLPHWSRSLFSR